MSRGFRQDIEGPRALAVLLVILDHAGIDRSDAGPSERPSTSTGTWAASGPGVS